MYQDETLVCRDCGEEFVFTVQEQQFYAEKGFENKPSRCRSCRISQVERNDRGREAAQAGMAVPIASCTGGLRRVRRSGAGAP